MTHWPPLPPDMFDELCPSSLLPFRFGDKWAALVIRCLEDGPRRFSELRVPLHHATPRCSPSRCAAWNAAGSYPAPSTPARDRGSSTR
jgi:hypothetical protein